MSAKVNKHKVARFPWLFAVNGLTPTQHSLVSLCVPGTSVRCPKTGNSELEWRLHVPGQRTGRTQSPIILSMSVKATKHKVMQSPWSFANFNSITRRKNTTRGGAMSEQFNVMLGTVPQPQDSRHVLICLSRCKSLSHRINHHSKGSSPHLRF